MKGIILAGGLGKRLRPSTLAISKHLLPVYDKPMIYYPLSTLMLSNIREILIISTPEDIHIYKKLLGSGHQLGVSFNYITQQEPKGVAEAFILAESFIEKENVCLALGDNIFWGDRFGNRLKKIAQQKSGATIFGYHVNNPIEFGIVEFDSQWNAISIEEKPTHPKSNYAIPGLYFYDNNVINIARSIKPSSRGELEISAINNEYLRLKKLKVELLGRGIAWLDTGTYRSLLAASNFIEAVQTRQGLYIACIEEIAYRQGFIDKSQLIKLAKNLQSTEYGQYILRLIKEF